jgi:Putative peptidoglycan binding domain
MKKFTSILIGCSLALAGAALAQQPEEQASPTQGKGKGKHAAETTQTQKAEPKSGANVTTPEATGGKRHGGKGAKAEVKSEANVANPANPEATTAPGKHGGAKAERRAAKMQKNEATTDAAASTESNVSGQAGVNAAPNEKQKGHGHGKGMKGHGANAETTPSGTPATAAASGSVAPTVAPVAGQQNVRGHGKGAGKKPDPQKLEQIKSQHANFRAEPKPDKVPAVTFNQSYRIEGSDRWQGRQYEVFRSYRPERHDEHFYRSHYSRVELIGGGYYYMNNGYWYPAWGYNPSSEYYAYDGPIYVGHRSEPPDRVIADVQAALQEMGYYTGEVDGLLGPLTRQALAGYQSEQGLTPTAAIDEPTLDSLGMG